MTRGGVGAGVCRVSPRTGTLSRDGSRTLFEVRSCSFLPMGCKTLGVVSNHGLGYLPGGRGVVKLEVHGPTQEPLVFAHRLLCVGGDDVCALVQCSCP